MDIAVSIEQGRKSVTVFQIKGAVDSSNYLQLEQRAKEAYDAGTRDLLIDLANVDYVSSAGIRAMNNILRLLRTDTPEESDEAMSQGIRDGTWKSPHLKLVNVPHRVSEAFRIAGVDMLLEMHDDRQKAVASF